MKNKIKKNIEHAIHVLVHQQIIKRDRFSLLLKFLHLNDNSKYVKKGQEGHDPLFKVRPFFDPLIKNFQLAYYPSRELSIDESMIGFKGRLSFIQHLPKKTNQVGDEGICPCRQQERVHVQLAAVHRYAETIKHPA